MTPGHETIYRIIDPRTNVVIYVGRTVNLTFRKQVHLNHCHSDILKQAIANIISTGHDPVFENIEVIEAELAHNRETYWIAYYLDLGVELYNKAQRNGRISTREYVAPKKKTPRPYTVLDLPPQEPKPTAYRRDPVILAAQAVNRKEKTYAQPLKAEERRIAQSLRWKEHDKAIEARKLERFTKKDAAIYDELEREAKLEALEIVREKEERAQEARVKNMIKELKALKEQQEWLDWVYGIK